MLSGIYNYFFPSPEPARTTTPLPPPSLWEIAISEKYPNSKRIKYFETMTAADIEKDFVGAINKTTWLCYFLRAKNDFMVEYLINKGVNVNQPDLDGDIPMIAAARAGNERGYLRLIQNGADKALTQEQIQSILFAACYSKCLAIVKDALARGADVNYKSKFAFTSHGSPRQMVQVSAIHFACNCNSWSYGEIGSLFNYSYPRSVMPSLEIIQALVSSGADVNAEYKFKELFRDEYLNALDKDTNWRNCTKFTPIAISMMGNLLGDCDEMPREELKKVNKVIIAFLVASGANIDHADAALKLESYSQLFDSDDTRFIENLVSKQVSDDLARLRAELTAKKPVIHSLASTSSTAIPSGSSTTAVVDASSVKSPVPRQEQTMTAIESRD